MDPDNVDLMNRHGVSVGAGGIVMMIPPMAPMSNEDALVLAAWLVTMTVPDDGHFDAILEQVQGT